MKHLYSDLIQFRGQPGCGRAAPIATAVLTKAVLADVPPGADEDAEVAGRLRAIVDDVANMIAAIEVETAGHDAASEQVATAIYAAQLRATAAAVVHQRITPGLPLWS